MTDLYIPPGCTTMDKVKEEPQMRLGLQGPPGCGKTWLALTFPNPIVANFDRGLIAHYGRSDVIEVPFYEGKFVDSIHPRDGAMAPPNRRDAFLKWLATEGRKLSPAQTLVLDNNKQIQQAFHTQYKINPVITKKGGENEFAEWNLKIEYYNDIARVLKELACDIIFICHETPDRNMDGSLNGLNRPLVSGQIGDGIAADYTDWYRILALPKPTSDTWDKFIARFGKTYTLKAVQDSTPNDSVYLLQTQSDNTFNAKTSLVNVPRFILASYSSISQYKRKQQPKEL